MSQPPRQQLTQPDAGSASRDSDFMHGSNYVMSGRVKKQMCKSCAFRHAPESVRDPAFTIQELEELSEHFDDFACHCIERKDGRADTCAGWHARFGQKGSAR